MTFWETPPTFLQRKRNTYFARIRQDSPELGFISEHHAKKCYTSPVRHHMTWTWPPIIKHVIVILERFSLVTSFYQLCVGVRHVGSAFRPGTRQARIRSTTARLLVEPNDDCVSKWLKWHNLCFGNVSQQGRTHTSSHESIWIMSQVQSLTRSFILCLEYCSRQ